MRRAVLTALAGCLAISSARAGTLIPVCTASGDQYAAAVSGQVVVWCDYRGGNPDIYGMNLATRQEFPICTTTASQLHPAISGNIVVWTDDRDGFGRVYGYDLAARQEFAVSSASSRVRFGPAISGNKVVWADARANSWHIYGCDIGGGGDYGVSTLVRDEQNSPAISGDLATWYDWWGGAARIMGRRLNGGGEFTIANDHDYPAEPGVSGDWVVWQCQPGLYQYEIHGRNVVSGATFAIAGSNQRMPQVSHWRVVYQADYGDIYMKDLASGQVLPICTTGGIQTEPAIDGDWVVWSDVSSGSSDIYAMQVPEPATLSLLALGGLAMMRKGK